MKIQALIDFFFTADRIYQHKILRINYTTYDVRRSQDVINPNTSHRDVMTLSDSTEDEGDHHNYAFARVLGIFHANVVYAPGLQKVDYRPRRVEFLWVRWFQPLGPPSGWQSRQLDCLSFPLLESSDAFGFLDPTEVIRACHILPRLALGRSNEDGRGVSKSVNDSDDWRMYYVNR